MTPISSARSATVVAIASPVVAAICSGTSHPTSSSSHRSSHSSPTSAAKRAFASTTRARPSSRLDDGRRHGGVLEREAAQVVGRWRQRAHGYANGRAVIALAAGRTSSAKRVAISRYSSIVPERTSKCIVRCE